MRVCTQRLPSRILSSTKIKELVIFTGHPLRLINQIWCRIVGSRTEVSGGKREKLDMADYKNINIRNKRATFDYEIIEEWIAGIVLVGTEIKSVRLGKASITDSYCYFDKGELWIRGVNIAEYGWGTCNNHVPRRDRKLLLNRKELNKIQRALQDKGLTVVGLRLFLNERGLAKVVVGLARGRKAYDKREYLKENDAKREMDKAMKKYRA